jgi:predicted nuclease of predicted toxin-antitoxin system
MRLLIDMNLSPRWVGFFAGSGFEAVHWSSLGDPSAADSALMAHAAANGFIVLTHDLDFSAILAATQGNKPSVVQIRAGDTSPEKIGLPVVVALRQMQTELVEGALLTVDPKRTRMRLLPLRKERPAPTES